MVKSIDMTPAHTPRGGSVLFSPPPEIMLRLDRIVVALRATHAARARLTSREMVQVNALLKKEGRAAAELMAQELLKQRNPVSGGRVPSRASLVVYLLEQALNQHEAKLLKQAESV